MVQHLDTPVQLWHPTNTAHISPHTLNGFDFKVVSLFVDLDKRFYWQLVIQNILISIGIGYFEPFRLNASFEMFMCEDNVQCESCWNEDGFILCAADVLERIQQKFLNFFSGCSRNGEK